MSTDLNRHEGYVRAWARTNKGRQVRVSRGCYVGRSGLLSGAVNYDSFTRAPAPMFYYNGALAVDLIDHLKFVDGKSAIAPVAVIEKSERWPESIGAQGQFYSVGGDPELFTVKGRSGNFYRVESPDFVRFNEAEAMPDPPHVENTKAVRQAAKLTNFSDAARKRGVGPSTVATSDHADVERSALTLAHDILRRSEGDNPVFESIDAMSLARLVLEEAKTSPLCIAARRMLTFVCGLHPREIADAREREEHIRQLTEALAPGKGSK